MARKGLPSRLIISDRAASFCLGGGSSAEEAEKARAESAGVRKAPGAQAKVVPQFLLGE